MKKILILGAKGMLGKELARVFDACEVLVWDLKELDITNEAQAMKKIGEARPDVVINAAAYNAVDKAEEEKEKAEMLNGRAVGFLARAAKNVGAIFIHYSTDYVFAGDQKEGYAENDASAPISAYGASKLSGEKEASGAGKFYIIRLSRLFGKMGDGQNVKKSFVDAMLDLGRVKKELDVVDEELSSPTYAPDLAERIKYVLDNRLPYGIYHAANAGACTWAEFAKEIFKQAGMDVTVRPVSGEKFPRPAKRPQFSVLLNTKLPPMRSWQEALGEYIASVVSGR
jgi:dTDP-4-dehydrorhamnose reductase